MDPNVFETANAGFAQAMYEEFLKDPSAVGPEWRRLFESGVVGESTSHTIYAGSLDDVTQFVPQIAIFAHDRPHWLVIPPGLTVFETMPEQEETR